MKHAILIFPCFWVGFQSWSKGNSLVTSVFDTESGQMLKVLCDIFCLHVHSFKNTAHNVAHRGPVQTNRQGQSGSRVSQLLRQ